MHQLAKFGFILAAAALFCWATPVLADGPTVPYKDHASGEVDTLGGTYPTFTQTYSGTSAEQIPGLLSVYYPACGTECSTRRMAWTAMRRRSSG